MATEIEIHSIQAEILRILLFKPTARFSQLNRQKITSDHFNFHLKRLLESDLIKKNKSGRYFLTAKGKEFANRFDTQRITLERQAKVGVLICAIKTDNKIKKYLVQQRLKQPSFGYHGFITGKVRWGETILEAASREFGEETGLEAQFSFAGVEHKIDYSKDKQLLEDKFFFIVRANKTRGGLTESFEGGRNFWFSKKEIDQIPKLFDDVRQILKIIDQKKIIFVENKFLVSGY